MIAIHIKLASKNGISTIKIYAGILHNAVSLIGSSAVCKTAGCRRAGLKIIIDDVVFASFSSINGIATPIVDDVVAKFQTVTEGLTFVSCAVESGVSAGVVCDQIE